MKFKIVEKFITMRKNFGGNVFFSLYKNPTTAELTQKNMSTENRGFVTVNGDLFIEMAEGVRYSEINHDALLSWLKYENLIKGVPENWHRDFRGAIGVHRIENSLDFQLSESVCGHFEYEVDKTPSIRKKRMETSIIPKLKKCKKKNPHLSFYFDLTRKEKLA